MRQRFRLGTRGLRIALLALIAFSLLGNLLSLTGALYMAQIYDRVLASHSLSTLAVLSAIAAALFVAQGLLTGTVSKLAERIGHRMLLAHEQRLLEDAGRRAAQGQRQKAAMQPVEDLMSVARAIRGSGLTTLLDLPWTPIFMLGLALVAPWMAAFALWAVVLLVAVVLTRGWLKGDPPTPDEDDTTAKRAWEAAFRSPNGNAAAAMATLGEKVAEARQTAREDERPSRERDRDGRAFIAVVRNMAQSGVLAVGAWLVISGQATIGVMMASTILIGRILAPVEALLRERKSILEAAKAWKRLRGLQLIEPCATPEVNETLATSELRADGLAVSPSRDHARVLQNIKFIAEPGQFIIAMGATGVGKSLLLRVLAGLQPPAAGSLRLGDVRYSELDVSARDALIGYAPQDMVFLPGSIADAVARYDQGIARADVMAACKRVEVHEAIMALPKGYDTPLTPQGPPLPFGLMRRLSLARAVCRRPHLLLLDEPLTGLDAGSMKIVTNLIAEQKANGGITIMAGYHPMFQEQADRIMLLADGKMAAFGPPSEVFKARTVSGTITAAKT